MKTPLRLWGAVMTMSGLSLVLLSAVVALQFLITLHSGAQGERIHERMQALNRFEYEQTLIVLAWEDAYQQDPQNWSVPENFKRIDEGGIWVLEGSLHADGFSLALRLALTQPRWRIHRWQVLPQVPEHYTDGDPVYGG